jgi:DNA repair protein RadC
MMHLRKECFWAVLLNGKNRFLKLVRVSEGSLTASLVHPREVFRPAILEAAAGLLCVHNHPSGDPAPSPEDLQITRRLVEVGRLIGIRVLDHVIVGENEYFSFADEGMI